jgi:glycosyltransferase involved in cell wall biosynthesis
MLSIIIPTLNEEKYLPLLLDSLKKQTFKDFEIIVADANSFDQTRLIAQKAGALVVEGGLPARGRNNGAKVARGEWLLFLDADVVLPFDFLEKALNEIQEKKLDIASPLLEPLSKKKIDKLFHEFYNFYARLTVSFYPHAPGLCIFVKKILHQLIGGFDEKVKLAEDHDYVNKAHYFGRFGLLKSVKVPVSVRRFEKDGRARIALKYIAAEAYRFIFGSINSDIFNYRFGHYQEENTKKR